MLCPHTDNSLASYSYNLGSHLTTQLYSLVDSDNENTTGLLAVQLQQMFYGMQSLNIQSIQ